MLGFRKKSAKDGVPPQDLTPADRPSTRYKLTPAIICRQFICLLGHQFPFGTFQYFEQDPTLIDGLMKRKMVFEAGDLELSIEDYAEFYLMPQVMGMASVLRMAGTGYDVFDMPMPKDVSCSRNRYDGISMLVTEHSDILQAEILFRPRKPGIMQDIDIGTDIPYK